MTIYTIYKATNISNGKVYIGFDSSWPKRKSEHKGSAARGEPYKFYNAIRKYGWDNFVWETIYQSLDYNYTLNFMESYFIKEYNSLKNGYNTRPGGGPKSAKGAKWWNNGIIQFHSHCQPDETFKPGRLLFNNVGAKIGAAVNRNKHWINNNITEMMIFKSESIPEGYALGRIQSPKFGKSNISTLGTVWWNNGITERMSKISPGDSYIKGRLQK
jgi:group I intron endonuclease